MKRANWKLAAICLAFSVLLSACAEWNSDAHKAHYRALVGETGMPSCGGSEQVVYLEGREIRKIEFGMETSQRLIDVDFYFRAGKLVSVVETSRLLLGDNAERLSKPRLEYRRAYRWDEPEKIPTDKKGEYEREAADLKRYFSEHEGEFKPAERT